MSRTDKPTTGDDQARHGLDEDQRGLVAALTAAIIASRRDRPEASDEAKASARQYAGIKRVLGTWAEPFPDPGHAGYASKG